MTPEPQPPIALTAPPPAQGATVQELADYYVANYAVLSALDTWMFQAKRRLGDACRDTGPIVTPSGRLLLKPTGQHEYPVEIAEKFPAFARRVVKVTLQTTAQAEQLLSIANEQFPDADLDVETKVDGRAVAAAISAGGRTAKRLIDLRTSKARLAVGT